MRLRPADLTDASSLAALSAEVWLGTYLKQGISAHFADYVLAEMAAQKVRAMLGADCEVSTVYVRPNAQGQGRGGALLGHLLAHVPKDASGLWLATNSENGPAIGFSCRRVS